MTVEKVSPSHLAKLDTIVEAALRAGKIPGAAVAIVSDGGIVFSKGYGYRDVESGLPVTAQTVYPIASTSKAINATLLGMLVDEGKLAWDAPVRDYLPRFQLGDPCTSMSVTLRDLITMRTGLPRHDWFYVENPIGRAELVERLRYLPLSSRLREQFQYTNVTVTAAGHIAEVVTGKSWEELIRHRILSPLAMCDTRFERPAGGNVTLSYCEGKSGELRVSRRLAAAVTAPSGGAIHSTVEDMARWILFNLNGGKVAGRQLVQPQTLKEIHAPQIVVGGDPAAARKPNATYAMGWSSDSYRGYRRLSHGGYLHDVNSEALLFPSLGIGVVTFVNFGPPMFALPIVELAFDTIMSIEDGHALEERLEDHANKYRKKVQETRHRRATAHRIEGATPSHSLSAYAGTFAHAGYGHLEVRQVREGLILHRHNLELPLRHWHFDTWTFEENDLFGIHECHAFDETSRVLFHTNEDGEVAALSICLEPAVSQIRFDRS